MSEAGVLLLAWFSVVGDVTPPPGWESTPGYALALRRVCEDMELVDSWQTIEVTLAHARDLYRSCAGCPRVWVLDACPSERCLDEQLAFARRHLAWLREQREFAGTDWQQANWDAWIVEAEELVDLYSALSYARAYRRIRFPIDLVRQQLGKAAQIADVQDLQMGFLPPPVPVWRFRRIP